MEIIIAENSKSMSAAAARLAIEQINSKPNSVLGLPTGSTPLGLYKNLVQAVRLKTVSFKDCRAFTLDEYAGLAKTDQSSFNFFMKDKFFDRSDIRTENTFTPDGQAEDLNQECANYDNLIKKQGGIDLLILGIGLDGHIGFNEPDSAFNSKTRVVKLTELTRRANARYFNNSDLVPRRAITIGLGTMMKAKKIILLASGERKAGIVKRAFCGRVTKSVPASVLQRHKNLTVILDKKAAKDLVVSG